jgi:5'-3' exonuclease
MNNIQTCDFLVFDISNLLFRAFYAQKGEDSSTINGMAIHIALTSLNMYYKEYKPQKRIVMTFDRSSWRKEYTASDQCISTKPYKGNRRQNLTPIEQKKYQDFQQHLAEFETLMRSHTTILTLACDRLEADDLMAGFVQQHPSDSIVIITADSDLAQLFKHPNVNIISPATNKPQSLSKFNNDPIYYLFQKCIRGDSTDNIQSAYPRIRSTKIEKAFVDPFEFTNLMKSTWTNQNGIEYVVESLFKENQILIDLEKQPTDIKELMTNTINNELQHTKKFSMFHMLKYLGKYELNKIIESIDLFVPMLSHKH